MNSTVRLTFHLIETMDKEVVICDMDHTILYMNQCAVKNYTERFGSDLIGKNLLDCHNENSSRIIKEKLDFAINNNENSVILTDKPDKGQKSYLTLIKDEYDIPIGYYERYEGEVF